MQTSRAAGTDASVYVSNIGGIEETTVDLTPGVNVLVGRNATNRTSFLQSLMAVSGSERASLKGDAEEGRVELELGDETFTRVLTRRSGGGVDFSGDPVLEDPELADLFAFLLEDNEARRAIATKGDLRDLVMRPVDTEAINDRIDELVAERERLDDEIESAEAANRRIPELEERRVELEDEIAEKREALEAKQDEIDEADAGVEESKEEKSELEDALDRLNDRRAELERVASRLENERSSLASVREEREDVEQTLEEMEAVPEDEAEFLDERVSSLRDRKRSLDSTITQLQSLIQFNEEMLDGEHTEVLQLLADEEGAESSAVTDALLPDSEHSGGRCWTCGSEVSMEDVEDTLDKLRSLAREKRQERSDVTSELEEVQAERNELETRVERRESLEERLEELGEEIEEREAATERLAAEREEAEEAVEELEETVEELEEGRHSAVLDLHREANELQFELNDLQDDLERVEEEIAEMQAEADRREDLEAEREELTAELEDLRTRIDRLEAEAVESFNEHMETVLDVLDYGNVSRVWIERATEQVREGRRKVEKTVFRLHVVRTGADGTAYEDTVDHLSESEREVIGLVFGLAGYLVHEVYEECPFMLLDSLEAIDSNRIAALVDYFHEYAPYIAVALLPEDAQALDDDYRRVTEI